MKPAIAIFVNCRCAVLWMESLTSTATVTKGEAGLTNLPTVEREEQNTIEIMWSKMITYTEVGKLFPYFQHQPHIKHTIIGLHRLFSILFTALLSSLLTSFLYKHMCTFTQTLLSLVAPGLPLWGGQSLLPSVCVRGCPGVSVITISQCSSLPISPAVITQTHMELSITRLLHTGTHPPSEESENDRETAAGREKEFPTAKAIPL